MSSNVDYFMRMDMPCKKTGCYRVIPVKLKKQRDRNLEFGSTVNFHTILEKLLKNNMMKRKSNNIFSDCVTLPM